MKNKYRRIFMLAFAMAFLQWGCGKADSVYEIQDDQSTLGALAEEIGSAASETEKETPEMQSDPADDAASAAEEMPAEETVQVYICGAVASPGVYELKAGSRVVQAIEKAGGLTEDADERALNQARELCDGEQITVWTRGETESFGISAQNTAEDGSINPETAKHSGKINLNTASKEQLMTLSGIGESRAEAILQYREANGNFSAIEEIMNIEGIKEKMFEKIRDSIEV